MRNSTVTRRKSGAISRTWMPAPRKGPQTLRRMRNARGPSARRQKNPCLRLSAATLNAFDQQGAALPPADAQRGDAATPAGALEHLEHVQDHARARGSDGMPDGDGAAVDVQLGSVELAEGLLEPEILAAVVRALPGGEATEHLRGESLVHLHRVDVVPAEGVAHHEGRDRMHRPQPHLRRIERAPVRGDNATKRLQAVLVHDMLP